MILLYKKITPLLFFIFLINNSIFPTSDKKEIIFGFSPWEPFIIDRDNNMSGIMVDVLEKISQKLGYTVKYENFPTRRISLMFEEGTIDVRPKSKEWINNPEQYVWSEPVTEVSDVLIYRRNKPISYNTITDLLGLNIGTILGYKYPVLETYFKNEQIIREDTTHVNNLLFKLLAERYDVAIIDKNVGLWLMKDNPQFQGKLEIAKKSLNSTDYRFMFNKTKDWQPFVNKFNKELSEMKKDGRLETILNKYIYIE